MVVCEHILVEWNAVIIIIVVVVVIITKVLIQVTHCKIHAAGALYKITEVQCACQ